MVLIVNNYSTIALNHMVGLRNVNFGLRTAELNWILTKINHCNTVNFKRNRLKFLGTKCKLPFFFFFLNLHTFTSFPAGKLL